MTETRATVNMILRGAGAEVSWCSQRRNDKTLCAPKDPSETWQRRRKEPSVSTQNKIGRRLGGMLTLKGVELRAVDVSGAAVKSKS